MTTELQDVGWRYVEVSPRASAGLGEDVPGVGYGVEVLTGGQFVQQVRFEPLLGAGDLQANLQEEWFDGKFLACPGGFKRLRIDWVIGTNAATNAGSIHKVVLRILTVPAAVFVRDSRPPYSGAARLLESTLHQVPGQSTVAVPAASNLTVHDGPTGRYQLVTSGAAPANRYASRHVGDQRQAWMPTPGLYFHGWIAATGPFQLWVYAYQANGDAAVGPSVYDALPSVLLESSPGPIVTTFEHIVILRTSSAHGPGGNPLPYPLDGARLVVVNAGGSSIDLRGILATRSS